MRWKELLTIYIDVPQGTELGPLLFINFINSLLNLDKVVLVISYSADAVLLFKVATWDKVNEKANIEIQISPNYAAYAF